MLTDSKEYIDILVKIPHAIASAGPNCDAAKSMAEAMNTATPEAGRRPVNEVSPG